METFARLRSTEIRPVFSANSLHMLLILSFLILSLSKDEE